jgi:aminobenzoyl-glutamate transport protein
MSSSSSPPPSLQPSSASQRLLDGIERIGNRLPDPALLFVLCLLVTWVLSALLSPVAFTDLDPRTNEPLQIRNQLAPAELARFISSMVRTFIEFPPLGLVIVAILGVGVAEHAGFISAALRAMLRLTPQSLLTPMLLLVGILSHAAGDSGHVLIIPLGGVIFAAAGRSPLLGITTAFAGVSGGFSACVLPTSLDPLLQGFTEKAAQIIAPERTVNPLCNWGFMSVSCLFIVGVGWYVSDRIIGPRLARQSKGAVDPSQVGVNDLSPEERRGLKAGLATLAVCLALLVAAVLPASSPMRSPNGELVGRDSPLMHSIVPLIFVLFTAPGAVYGFAAGTLRNHRDVIEGMTKSMGSINYYLVMAFFAAQFTSAFTHSNLGVLLAIKGAKTLQAWNLPPQLMIVGVVALTTSVNLFIGSASAKWALLGPILVPMLMSVGLSPELTQCAYRIGDSSTNIMTPLMPYFPLVVVYMQRYDKEVGIGTLVSLMLPYSLAFLVSWTGLLMVFWSLGIPLGLQGGYSYPP